MRTAYRNMAFLVELLVNILVFSVSCAVLVGLFGKAWQLSRQTGAKDRAGVEVQAVIETARARGARGMNPAETDGDGTMIWYYDADWQALQPPYPSRDAIAYAVRLHIAPEDTGAGTLARMTAVASTAGGEEMFRLETAAYRPREGA